MDNSRNCMVNCELFGRQAEYFESKVVPLWQGVYDSLVARAGVNEGETVLDCGTGPGEVAIRIAARVGPNGRVVAVDAMEEMLTIAKRKAQAKGLGNIDFRRMSLEEMDLDDSSFDSVVGNYSLCCTMDYPGSLKEIYRVLKPGGKLTYNHGGMNESTASQMIYEIFEDFKTREPSQRLCEFRKSDEEQNNAVEKFRDSRVTIPLLRSLGFRDSMTAMVQRSITYGRPEDMVERMLSFDWRIEAEELTKEEIEKFRERAVRELRLLYKGPLFRVEDEMVFYTAFKP